MLSLGLNQDWPIAWFTLIVAWQISLDLVKIFTRLKPGSNMAKKVELGLNQD